MIIHVTQADINVGRRETPFDCPVACAMKRELGTTVSVGRVVINIYQPEGKISRWVPPEVRDRITDFDLGKGMTPFDFELED